MTKTKKVDALIARVTINIPLADPGGYDAAKKAINMLDVGVDGAVIDVTSCGLGKMEAPSK